MYSRLHVQFNWVQSSKLAFNISNLMMLESWWFVLSIDILNIFDWLQKYALLKFTYKMSIKKMPSIYIIFFIKISYIHHVGTKMKVIPMDSSHLQCILRKFFVFNLTFFVFILQCAVCVTN